ncbi:MAG: TonB-dependent receptor [Luteimonas sp.]
MQTFHRHATAWSQLRIGLASYTPRAAGVLLALLALPAAAQQDPDISFSNTATTDPDPVQLDSITILGRRQNLVGEAISASEGAISQADIANRPLLRTGDLLELVPGLVATQHSGSGKANQYFLRGFNLDHGTDFSTWVDGMPVNMRTHGHGQGWTDLNFLVPEAVEQLTYRKGTYYADVGDFSSAGSARFHIADEVPHGQLGLSVGEDGYARGVVVDSVALGAGQLLYAGELQAYDGPWTDIKEDVRKGSGLLRYSAPMGNGRAHVMVMGYTNEWNSPDQIPQRAVASGLISEFGSLDTTVGGESSRYSLSGGWAGIAFGGEFSADAYAIDSALNLWSNFTYFLDDPDNGDQFQQVDERRLYGFNASQQWESGRSRWRVGAEGRFDDIGRVALLRTNARQLVSTVRDDSVEEGSLGVFVANEFRFNDQWRSYLGVRRDEYDFKVDSSLTINSGHARAGQTSYKASLAYTPGDALELYASAGTGFHSNDARGTTIRVDPGSGEPVDRVDPLVESIGAEIGSRLYFSDRLQATLALWTLRLDSELLFVGDAGTTEPSRPSKRDGIEAGVYWFGGDTYTANLEASYSRSRFRDSDPVGNEIPGSIPLVVSAGLTGKYAQGWTASAQLKYFGKYPLIEDGSVESDGSMIVNLRVGREWDRFGLHMDLLNALDSDDHDVDYFYASRLQAEPEEGVEDIHFHVFPSRSVRLSLQYRF